MGYRATVDFATKGMAAAEAFNKISRTLKYPLAIDPDIQQAIGADDPVRDELQGLSAGTALAALARPVGATLRPRETASGSLEYTLTKSKAAPRHGRSAGRPIRPREKSSRNCWNR